MGFTKNKKGDIEGSNTTKTIENISISLIKPYWRNIQVGTNIEEVKHSIERFGYNSLIVVDKDYVIINGHSRYKALKDLGYGNIDVVVLDISERLAKKYRVIDNKIADLNEINMEMLVDELKLLLHDGDDIVGLYDNYELESMGVISLDPLNDIDDNIGDTVKHTDGAELYKKKHINILMCPNCYGEFEA